MNSQVIFTESQNVIELYQEFKNINGNLYHYTSKEKLESIKGGNELWITRSDSFLDKEEVKYGLNILQAAAKETLDKEDDDNFNIMLASFDKLLINSYIFSASNNSSSEYLINNYGKNIIKFSNNFSMSLGALPHHAIKNGDGFRLYYFSDYYESVEGHVVYDAEHQKKISNMAVKAMSEIIHPSGNIPDIYHVRKILLMCISLFKNPSYHQEEEYRIVLIRKSSNDNIDFNSERENKEKYIKAVIPNLHKRFITHIEE